MRLFTKRSIWTLLVFIGTLLLAACASATTISTSLPMDAKPTTQDMDTVTVTSLMPTQTSIPIPTNTMATSETAALTPAPTKPTGDLDLADVLSIAVNGNENAYTFSVEIRSSDTGCEQYANWWEVVTEDGELIYRRILGHSHVSEQPFTRFGGPVAIGADTIVIVRAHMFPDGYGGAAFQGSVNKGFEAIQLEADFAPELESANPLPDGCAF